MAQSPVETVVWTDAQHAAVVSQMLALIPEHVRVLAVGGPGRPEVAQLAQRLEVESHDDPRKLLVQCPSEFLVLASHQGITASQIRSAMDQGTVVLALEPVFESFDALEAIQRHGRRRSGGSSGQGGSGPGSSQRAGIHGGMGLWTLSPDFLFAPGWAKAADPLPVLGRIESLSWSGCGQSASGSLLQRLLEAWQVILHFVEMPQSVDAALFNDHNDVPQSLSELTGHMTVHARLGQSAAVVMQLSDQAGPFERRLQVLGQHGALHASDWAYALHDYRCDALEKSYLDVPEQAFAHLLSRHFRQVIDQRDAGVLRPVVNADQILACAAACQLSARTGQPESPSTLLSMHTS